MEHIVVREEGEDGSGTNSQRGANMDQEDKELDWSIIGCEMRRLWGAEWEKWKMLICKKGGFYMRHSSPNRPSRDPHNFFSTYVEVRLKKLSYMKFKIFRIFF